MKYQLIICFLNTIFSTDITFSQSDKELLRNEDGIKILSEKNASGDRITITGVTKIRGDIQSAAALMHDADNYTDWFHAAVISEKKKVFAPNDFIYYLKSDLPWAADDRYIYSNGNYSE